MKKIIYQYFIKLLYINVKENVYKLVNKVRITFSHLYGSFDKFVETYEKITSKSGDFDIVFILGQNFTKNKSFSLITNLEKISKKTPIYILDCSPVGVIFKHKEKGITEIFKNIFILNRFGIFEIGNLHV